MSTPKALSRQCWPILRKYAPPLNFITFHFLYFIGTCFLGAMLLWGCATPSRSLSFTDSVFLAVSAMTEAGLNTENLSQLNTFQQVVLFLLIMSGSGVLVSAVVVQVRKAAFERKFRAIVEAAERDRTAMHSSSPDVMKTATFDEKAATPDQLPSYLTSTDAVQRDSTGSAHLPRVPPPLYRAGSSQNPAPDSGMLPTRSLGAAVQLRLENSKDSNSEARNAERRFPMSLTTWIGGRSKSGLNTQERKRLGGSEYRAVCLLAWVVPMYYVLFQLLGALGCAAWIAHNQPDTARENGLNPWWVGAFKAISAFNNSGMDLLDKNMQPFTGAYYLLITMSLLILAGNTCYPVFLRLIIWSMLKVAECFEHRSEEWAERVTTLKFLLKHPRRCYTLLFPAKHTWWLLTSVVVLNGIDWAAYGILSIDNPAFAGISAGDRTIDGLFQAFAIRSGGFSVMSISSLHIALQLLYVLMMYISVYPLLMTMRTSNVYEERFLGIYGGEEKTSEDRSANSSEPGDAGEERDARRRSIISRLLERNGPSSTAATKDRVSRRLRGQLAHDVWWMAFALFCILLIEERHFSRNPTVFSVFNFIFEIVSAYGTVGVSTGVPWNNYSFCGAWQKGSKLILCAVMLRGRHRGLPVAIDKAVLLPGEEQDVDVDVTGHASLAHGHWDANRDRYETAEDRPLRY